MGRRFRPSTLVFYDSKVKTKCGVADKSVGPFYCILDEKTYISLSFWRFMQEKLHARADVGRAFVLAHEYGHHIMISLGVHAQMLDVKSATPVTREKAISRMCELTADALAGYWMKDANKKGKIGTLEILEAADIAALVGDDTVYRINHNLAVDAAVPRDQEWTHGDGFSRRNWFLRGFGSEHIDEANAFIDPEMIREFPPRLQRRLYSIRFDN